MSALAGNFAAVAITLYAAHHVGDYWVQRDEDAQHKGDAGARGRLHCLFHVCSYLMTQNVMLVAAMFLLDVKVSPLGGLAALTVSGVTHYMADRREHGLMFKLARLLPSTKELLQLGRPRQLRVDARWIDDSYDAVLDNPQLATGAWALDQAWHIFWGVFVAALLAVTL